MSNRAETMPWIHRVNVEQAMQGLDYGDMVRLAVAFHDWAFNEVGIDGDQRTRLLMLSVDYERIAEFCGPAWTASDPSREEDLIAFVARVLREERRPTIRSSTGEGSATSNEVHGEPAAPPSTSEFLDSFASCMETIILEDDNPEDLMNEIMRHAERAGIIDATGAIRTGSPWVFVMDLLTDNPGAFEWAQFARERTDLQAIKDSEQLLNAIYS